MGYFECRGKAQTVEVSTVDVTCQDGRQKAASVKMQQTFGEALVKTRGKADF